MAMKQRERHIVETYTAGGTEIPRGTLVVLSSNTVVASGANADKFIGVTVEIGYADKDVRVAMPGSTVLALAHDSSVTEGQLLESSSTARCDSMATNVAGAPRYIVGRALRAPTAAGELFPIRVLDQYNANPS